MNQNISVVLLGAGKSGRFKSNTIKQNFFINNKSIVDYSRDFFSKNFPKSKIYLIINNKVIVKKIRSNELVIYGSSSRLKSLYQSLEYIFKNNLQTKYTMIHDIARPALNINDIKKLIKSMKAGIDGSTLGYPLTNAIKEVKKNLIMNNICRDNIWSSFTPQIFNTEKLYVSVCNMMDNDYMVDDDVESLLISNFKCSVVKSSPNNIKVTYIEDIEALKKIL